MTIHTPDDAVIGLRCLACNDFLPRPIDAEDLEAWVKAQSGYLAVHNFQQGGHSKVVEVYSGLPRWVEYDC